MLETIATTMRTASHPTFLISSKITIIFLKSERSIKSLKIAIGEINSDTVNEQVSSLVAAMTNIEGYSRNHAASSRVFEQSSSQDAMSQHLEVAHKPLIVQRLIWC